MKKIHIKIKLNLVMNSLRERGEACVAMDGQILKEDHLSKLWPLVKVDLCS